MLFTRCQYLASNFLGVSMTKTIFCSTKWRPDRGRAKPLLLKRKKIVKGDAF